MKAMVLKAPHAASNASAAERLGARSRSRRIVLPRVDSAAQEKYASGRVTLYLDGEKALVTEDSIVLAGRCESAVALPVAPQMRY